MNTPISPFARIVADLRPQLENTSPERALGAASQARKGPTELALLLSPGAARASGELRQRAHHVTRARFGLARNLYAPLYISNHCGGRCPYCGFGAQQKFSRRRLSVEEVVEDAKILRDQGVRHILLVSGDDPRVDLAYLTELLEELRLFATSVQVELPAMDVESYRALAKAGVDGVTLYQEAYDPDVYQALHPSGPKADYEWRLDTLERAGRAGMVYLGPGALLGLAPFRTEVLSLGIHALGLEKRCWKSSLSFGLPRLHNVPDGFSILHPVTDEQLIQVVVALRLCFEDAGITISTRESAELRALLVDIGATRLSAGSRTEPGGYKEPGSAQPQFSVGDSRTVAAVARSLEEAGFDPVLKDWDRGFASKGIKENGNKYNR